MEVQLVTSHERRFSFGKVSILGRKLSALCQQSYLIINYQPAGEKQHSLFIENKNIYSVRSHPGERILKWI